MGRQKQIFLNVVRVGLRQNKQKLTKCFNEGKPGDCRIRVISPHTALHRRVNQATIYKDPAIICKSIMQKLSHQNKPSQKQLRNVFIISGENWI